MLIYISWVVVMRKLVSDALFPVDAGKPVRFLMLTVLVIGLALSVISITFTYELVGALVTWLVTL